MLWKFLTLIFAVFYHFWTKLTAWSCDHRFRNIISNSLRPWASQPLLHSTCSLPTVISFALYGESPVHSPVKCDAYILIQSGVIDIFSKSKMAEAAILDFQVMWISLFRHVDSVVFVLSTKFASSNICYSHWDRRTYASDFHLMTSRPVTRISSAGGPKLSSLWLGGDHK